jgi:hypothetical protein
VGGRERERDLGAYAIASAAERIYGTRTGEVGSIGIVAAHVDQSGADAKAGLACGTARDPSFDDLAFEGAASVRTASVPVSLWFTTSETSLS